MAQKTTEDYKKLLEKIKKQSGGSGSKFEYKELSEGKNVGRVAPGHPNMEGFFVEVWQHGKGVGKDFMSVICLNHGDTRATECLIDSEDLEPLRLSKDKADKKQYSEEKAKPRYFLNWIDRDDDDKLVVLPCGSTILKGILGYVTDPLYGDVLSLTEGRDIIIEKTGKGKDTDYEVKIWPVTSPILPKKSDIVKLIGKADDGSDTQLNDLTELTKAFEGEADKTLLVWREGWKALADLADLEDKDEKSAAATKKPVTSTDKNKTAAQMAAEASAESEEAEEAESEQLLPLKSRCAVCGDKRFKGAVSGTVSCKAGHGGSQLAEGAKPTKPSKAYLVEFPPEPEVAAVTKISAMKSRCAVCGDKRFKYNDGSITCEAGHGGAALPDGERPSQPSKAYLKEFPEPVEVTEEEEEEDAAPAAKTGARKPAATAAAPQDDDEGLDDLDAILAKHAKK